MNILKSQNQNVFLSSSLLVSLQTKIKDFPALSGTSTNEISTFHKHEALKRYPFWAEPSRTSHYRGNTVFKAWNFWHGFFGG